MQCSAALGGGRAVNVPSEVSASFTTCSAKAMSSMVPLTYRAEAAPSSRHRSTTCTNTACQNPPGPALGTLLRSRKGGVCAPRDASLPQNSGWEFRE